MLGHAPESWYNPQIQKMYFEALKWAMGLDDDLHKTLAIKGKAMTADAALCRALAHVAYHVGQIVLLGRAAKAGNWDYLSIPR
ncbi:MAG TPA: DUF1572 family protein [Blastocatellia bacterium]|jgi:hypothetical protein|nr:DUF1572 family protein [Blastocatellia bacterium]